MDPQVEDRLNAVRDTIWKGGEKHVNTVIKPPIKGKRILFSFSS